MSTLQLTKEQTKVVNSDCKINVTLSVPGSGKTSVLVARAERLWRETKEPILIVTFSNDACENIEKRLSLDAKTTTTIKTIHAFCYEVVRTYWKELGQILGGDLWPSKPSLVTREQEISLIEELFKGEKVSNLYDLFLYLRSLNTDPEHILSLFKKKVYFEKTRQVDIEKFIYFETERKSRGLITFDDMTSLAESLIPLPYVSVDLSRKYSHILIDEAQDTSSQQWKILRPLIVEASTSLCVGDKNQAIYSFRGADGSVLLNMQLMQESVTFRLSKSFRSGSTIANVANKVCHDSSSQIVPQDHMGNVSVFKFPTVEEEAEWVLKNICKDSAIISRTNSYLEKFERQLIEKEINYMGKSFYRSRHVEDIINFIENYSASDVIRVLDKAYINNLSFSRQQIDDFKLIIKILQTEGKDTLFDLVNKSKYLDSAGVTLITGHSSKGLEWKRVFLVGCHTGHIPHKHSNDEKEERNLLYVMTSRAQDDLIITCVGSPSIFLPKEVRDGCTYPN